MRRVHTSNSRVHHDVACPSQSLEDNKHPLFGVSRVLWTALSRYTACRPRSPERTCAAAQPCAMPFRWVVSRSRLTGCSPPACRCTFVPGRSFIGRSDVSKVGRTLIYTSTVLLSNLEPPGTSLRALRASRVAIVLPRKQNRHCVDAILSAADNVLGWDIRPTTRTTHCASCVRLEHENEARSRSEISDTPMHACEGTQKVGHCEQTGSHPDREVVQTYHARQGLTYIRAVR